MIGARLSPRTEAHRPGRCRFSVIFFAALAFEPDVGTATYTPDPGETIDPAVLAERNTQLLATVNGRIRTWLPRIVFVLVPLFAVFVMLVCRRRGAFASRSRAEFR